MEHIPRARHDHIVKPGSAVREHGLSRANAETAPDWANRPEGNPYNIPYVARWVEWSFKWLEQVFYGGNYSIHI